MLDSDAATSLPLLSRLSCLVALETPNSLASVSRCSHIAELAWAPPQGPPTRASETDPLVNLGNQELKRRIRVLRAEGHRSLEKALTGSHAQAMCFWLSSAGSWAWPADLQPSLLLGKLLDGTPPC